MTPTPQLEIGILDYRGAQSAAIFGMTDLLTVARRLALPADAAKTLQISHWRIADRTASRVFQSNPAHHQDAKRWPTVLVIPPSLALPSLFDPATDPAVFLRSARKQGVILGSVCAGAFLLAEAGLLSGRRVTTHWTYADLFRRRFPDVHLDPDSPFIDDGDLLSAGGVMAWTDLSLELVSRLLGRPVMLQAARAYSIDPPAREQRFYSDFRPLLDHGDEPVLRLQLWLAATHARDIRLARLADIAGLQPRTLLRRFLKATGLTTNEYGQRVRVAQAQTGLRDSRSSIDQIAWDVGYADPASFREVFFRIVGLTPSAYRRRFGPN